MKKLKPLDHKWYGWRQDNPDIRDLKFVSKIEPTSYPPSINLEDKCPPIVNQGALGSCTANAIGGALHFEAIRQLIKNAAPVSRLFIYWNERFMEGTVDSDSGASIRDGIKSVNTLGAPFETDWSYDISKFKNKPSAKAFTNAKRHLTLTYESVAQNLSALKAPLVARYPFVFGFTVYDSFESQAVAKTGIVPMPKPSEGILGGHAVMAVGYDDATQRFRVRNSWGTDWGQAGYFEIPYAYLTNPNLSDDFWVIKQVMRG